MSGGSAELVVFALGGSKFALPLAGVRRALRAAEVTPLPGAPHFVSGMLDVQGEAIAVIDMRARLGLAPRPVSPDDQFLLADARGRVLALHVDRVEGVTRADVQALPDAGIAGASGETLRGLARLVDGLVLIHDLGRFLSGPDERLLANAMEAAA